MAEAARLDRLLRERFGHDSFRGQQRAIIEHVVGGGSAIVVQPTGEGKSLCFQLPSLMLDGLTVVISPLIALMQDQVDAARARGLPATFINSSLSREEREARWREVVEGRVRLLYVTPERFRVPGFSEAIAGVRVDLLAVDEAHCISSWGHDFRPAYGMAGAIRRTLGDPPCIALTATATPATIDDIRGRLNLVDAPLFHGGLERPNLELMVRNVGDLEEKLEFIRSMRQEIRGSAIVYFALIRDLEMVHEELARSGVRSLVYHGRMSAIERRALQRRFIGTDDELILATNAFGLGIDKPDIRMVIHAQVPGSLEAYWQEIGRAGRDGLPSLCAMLYQSSDLLIQKSFVDWSNPDAALIRGVANVLEGWGDRSGTKTLEDLREELLHKSRGDGRVDTAVNLLEARGIVSFDDNGMAPRLLRALEVGEESAFQDAEKRTRDLLRLQEIVQWANADTCRRLRLEEYFGVPSNGECGRCDVCSPGIERRFSGSRANSADEDVTWMPAEGDRMPLQRGDWIILGKRSIARVLRVERQGRGFKAEIEFPDDLARKTIDLDRDRWRPLK